MAANRGVLFDVDGTLVDTTYLHAVAWWEAIRQHDHDVPMAEIHRAIGMGSDKLLDHLLGDERDKDQDERLNTAHEIL
jgi:phosphoglycolate phosphatase-like HAD superfamily hydrolase